MEGKAEGARLFYFFLGEVIREGMQRDIGITSVVYIQNLAWDMSCGLREENYRMSGSNKSSEP